MAPKEPIELFRANFMFHGTEPRSFIRIRGEA